MASLQALASIIQFRLRFRCSCASLDCRTMQGPQILPFHDELHLGRSRPCRAWISKQLFRKHLVGLISAADAESRPLPSSTCIKWSIRARMPAKYFTLPPDFSSAPGIRLLAILQSIFLHYLMVRVQGEYREIRYSQFCKAFYTNWW
jgi:hypothetical protein